MKELEVPQNAFHAHLTCAEYAAIHLRIPDSGTPWLDAMIRKRQRLEAATATFGRSVYVTEETAVRYADALLAAMAENGAER